MKRHEKKHEEHESDKTIFMMVLLVFVALSFVLGYSVAESDRAHNKVLELEDKEEE